MNPQSFVYQFTPDIIGFAYDLTAQLALFAMLLILLYEGKQRQFPLASWTLSIAIIITIALLGSRLATFDIAAWQYWWADGLFLEGNQRSSIAVALFFLLAVLLIKKGLRFNTPFIDAFAFAFPVIVIIRRIGCFMAACCYGLPTKSGWGIQYMGPGQIRDHHWLNEIAGATKLGSAAVHPTPLYFIITSIITLLLLAKYRSRFKQAGNFALFSLTLLLGFRFFVEFTRDPVTNHQLGDILLGIKDLQWFLLLIVLSLATFIWYRERRPLSTRANSFPTIPRLIVGNALLAAFIFWMQDGFTLAEKVGIHSFMILSWLTLFAQMVRATQPIGQLRWQASLMALVALGMISQTYPTDIENLTDQTIKTVKMNWNTGNVNDPTYDCLRIENGCGGDYCALADTINPSGPRFNQFDIGFDVKKYYGKESKRTGKIYTNYYVYGVDFQPEFFYNKERNHRVTRANVMPYIGMGSDIYELKFGLRVGSIWGTGFSDGIGEVKQMVPSFSMRLGNIKKMYINLSNEQSTASGASIHSLDLNINFNLSRLTDNRWQYLRIGFSDIYFNHYLAYFESGFQLNKNWSITPRIGIAFSNDNDGLPEKSFTRPTYGIGAYYQLGK